MMIRPWEWVRVHSRARRLRRQRAMPHRVTGFALAIALGALSCSPKLPPATVPPQPDRTFDPFKSALQAYVDQTQPYRRQAAAAAERVPGKAAPQAGSEESVRTRQSELADALRTKLRPDAKQGDIFTPLIVPALKHQIEYAFASPKRDLLMDELAEQNTTPANARTPVINQQLDAPRVPPRLIAILPPLPAQLEYDFVGRTLVLRDVDAEVVVDFLADALPEIAPAGVPTAQAPSAAGGLVSPLPMPTIRGATLFAAMGDSGSGDIAQQQVAQAMLTYFTTARRFPFVLMLGDNLYDDDYTNEFLVPYKPLLDRDVKFYAAIGNHDRDLEVHFKPFNMQDSDRYTFDQGNARFVVLNSNHPTDPQQIKWLDGVFTDAGEKWRIAFFHHPLYSSGQHAAESAEVIRPALEAALVRNRVDVVLSGHEHLYQRIKPQKGITYFVSGGGGRYLYKVQPRPFDEVAISEHHFMVLQVAGDRLFFEAISHSQTVLDCGVLFRTSQVKPDNDTRKWQADCDAARTTARVTQSRR
jgi:predicted phosphodiesterase